VLSYGAWPSLDFFRGQEISHLVIRSSDVDWAGVSALQSLQALVLEGAFEPTIEFKELRKLEFLEAYWDRELSSRLSGAGSLRALRLHKAPEAAADIVKGLSRLESLSIVQATNLRYLSSTIGPAVRFAEFTRCSKLEKIGDLSSASSLDCMNIVRCSAITSVDDATSAPYLKELLFNVRQVSSLKSLENANLEKLRFDCQVEDGDLRFLLQMPRLRFCLFKKARNFNVSVAEVQKVLTERGNDQVALRDQLSHFPFPSEFIGD
jgi:hypothetical protein